MDKTEQSQSTGETDSKSASAAEPFMLGEGLPVIPAKLVAKILKGTYVDMADLLQDNIALEKRVSATDQETGALKSTVGKKRELTEDVQGLLSWAECFNTYTCVVVSKAPDKFKPLTAYQSMVIRETRRFGFRGWLQYDHLFRQQAARSSSTTDWERLNPALYALSFLSRQRGDSQTCSNCMCSDHPTSLCALQKRGSTAGESRRPWQRERPGPSTAARPAGKRQSRICYSWNDGKCSRAPNCSYRHICLHCEGDHKAAECSRKQPRLDREEPASDAGRSPR